MLDFSSVKVFGEGGFSLPEGFLAPFFSTNLDWVFGTENINHINYFDYINTFDINSKLSYLVSLYFGPEVEMCRLIAKYV